MKTTPNPKRIDQSMQAGMDLAGERLDQVAGQLWPDFSRARLQKWIRDGALTLDGRRCKPSERLTGGEHLHLQVTLEPEGDDVAEAIPLALIFEDEDVIVLDKPAGLVVHPAAGHASGTLLNALLHHRPELQTLPRAGIVHRLDKDTTGTMVVAASLRAHHALVRQLQDRSMGRIYECVAVGSLHGDGTVDAPIGRHPVNRVRMAVVANGKPAVTHYRVLRQFAHFTHLEVSLETGRTHQIRVHLAHEGYPLAGDPLYGRRPARIAGITEAMRADLDSLGRQALHARTLAFHHPADGELRRFEAPLPADFRRLLQQLDREDAA
jgi:23S rRNA pseudouridine1911/1915/1917 synthase